MRNKAVIFFIFLLIPAVLMGQDSGRRNYNDTQRNKVFEFITFTVDGSEYRTVEAERPSVAIMSANKYVGGTYKIPSAISYEGKDYEVMMIEKNAFDDRNLITSLEIPPTITSIKEHAFAKCVNLKKVEITDLEAWLRIKFEINSNPLEYAHYLFVKGKELKSLTVPHSIREINDYAFVGCWSLNVINVTTNVRTIGSWAFSQCKNMNYATISSGVNTIGNSAFSYCEKLTVLTLPFSVKSVGSWAFSNCNKLKTVYLPEKLTVIPWGMFDNCTSLSEIKLPDKLTSIEKHAFGGCEKLTSIDIPQSVNTIGDNAFLNCVKLKTVILPSWMKDRRLDDYFKNCPLKSIKYH